VEQNKFDAGFNGAYDKAFYDRQWDELKLRPHHAKNFANTRGCLNLVVNKAQ
jgi:hypothetical protein